jgi:DNA adenine methylase
MNAVVKTPNKCADLGMNTKPLLKWAGGKRQLLDAIRRRLPDEIDTYYEPFVGGGAVFFSLVAEGRFRKAVLSDQNAELIETYQAVRDDVNSVIRELRKFPHSEEAYYHIRSIEPRTAARRAARMIYLNRTGYNGLYRVNRSGKFNVPYGRYVRPNICDEDRLLAVSRALRGVKLCVADFEVAVRGAKKGDVVYFDPPYVPVSSTARFAEYHHTQFGDEEHERLADRFGALWERGVSVVLSNSDTPRTRALYSSYVFEVVSARRSINSAPGGRGATNELLVYQGARRAARAVGQR